MTIIFNDKSCISFVILLCNVSFYLERQKTWHKIQEFCDSVFRTTLDSDLFGILCEIIKDEGTHTHSWSI